MESVPQDEATPSSRVFICHARDNPAHEAIVGNFAEFLHAKGVDVVPDQLAKRERRDWDLWARQAITQSRHRRIRAPTAVTLDGEAFTTVVGSEDDRVAALAVEHIDDRLFAATGGDDRAVRLIEHSVGGSTVIHNAYDGHSVVTVAALATDGRATVVAADRYGGLVAATAGDGLAPTIDLIPWQVTHLIAMPTTAGRRLFGVASTPQRLLNWLSGDGHLRLERRPLGDLRGIPLHVARTTSAVAVAGGGGQLLLVGAVTAQVTAANLNITVDALAGVPETNMFVAARGVRLVGVAAHDGR
jgi:hypothetical protein